MSLLAKPKTSEKFDLNRTDKRKWLHNARKFLAPLALLYLGSVIAVISQPGHVVSLNDFVPTTMVVGAMVLYLLNTLFDLFTKWASENSE